MSNNHGGVRSNSGRKKGSPNKNKQDILELIQGHPLTKDFDPLVSLAVMANGQIPESYKAFQEILEIVNRHKKVSKNLKQIAEICLGMIERPVLGSDNMITATKEISQYVYPKLRSTEVTGEITNTQPIININYTALNDDYLKKMQQQNLKVIEDAMEETDE